MRSSSSHQVDPIPAYDVRSQIIRPSQYRAQLQEALVRLDFTINYWYVKKKVFLAADIEAIRVLELPSTTITKRNQFTTPIRGRQKN